MNNSNSLKILALTSGLIFALLFWKHSWGINSFIYSLLLLLTFTKVKGLAKLSGPVMITAIGTLLSSFLIVVNNSDYAKVTWILSLLLWMGFHQNLPIKSFFNAAVLGITNFFESPIQMFSSTSREQQISFWKTFWKKITLMVIPIALVITFFWIYYNANPKFAQLYNKIADTFRKIQLLQIDPGILIMIVIGTMLFGGIFFTSRINGFFNRKEADKREDLVRKRRKIQDYFSNINGMSLKKEYKIGVLVLALLNLQLAIVNILDLIYVWFSFEQRSAPELSQFVHQGTSLLILAIILAMAVILWFFRGNINFLSGNKFIKQLVYAWIIQNSILTFSVGMRNFHYIQDYGLAYKRIGVFFFLVLVLYGLWTVREKVRAPKSFFYLFQKNAWFFYFTLLVFSSINWHVAITKFNISKSTSHAIDTYFLINMIPDHNLYVLLDNKDKLLRGTDDDKRVINHQLEKKKDLFLFTQKKRSWQSFNFPDWRNERYLHKH
jgi:hypothetical protein